MCILHPLLCGTTRVRSTLQGGHATTVMFPIARRNTGIQNLHRRRRLPRAPNGQARIFVATAGVHIASCRQHSIRRQTSRMSVTTSRTSRTTKSARIRTSSSPKAIRRIGGNKRQVPDRALHLRRTSSSKCWTVHLLSPMLLARKRLWTWTGRCCLLFIEGHQEIAMITRLMKTIRLRTISRYRRFHSMTAQARCLISPTTSCNNRYHRVVHWTMMTRNNHCELHAALSHMGMTDALRRYVLLSFDEATERRSKMILSL